MRRSPQPPEVYDLEIASDLVVISLPLEGTAAETVELSEAEVAVARAAATGYSNAEIARLRGTSARTVANQLAAVYAKLGVSSRAQLAAWLLERA